MTNLAVTERAQLCDLLERAGPAQPTLCEGWLTRDLAAHLVLREGRLDAAAGIVVPFLAGWTARVQRALASGDYARLVQRLSAGPPRWSPLRIATIEENANNIELFVHHEDVRRAQPQWQPRELDAETRDLLWRRARRIARLALRSEPAGVELIRADTGERSMTRSAQPEQPVVTLTGNPEELVIYLYGRRAHAVVERAGHPGTVQAPGTQ